ncbi:hypothetical protein AVEN_21013-1 [Araneus ventricosus]|uniref:Uncharacterized protein n=1 Tax=Araneus ventricosus TaxID=182803 RepID=A0A4Y2D7Z3_ARAVE|nr:hypothetical protein AVEN_21013-1 [Araneus ventricosus]
MTRLSSTESMTEDGYWQEECHGFYSDHIINQHYSKTDRLRLSNKFVAAVRLVVGYFPSFPQAKCKCGTVFPESLPGRHSLTKITFLTQVLPRCSKTSLTNRSSHSSPLS